MEQNIQNYTIKRLDWADYKCNRNKYYLYSYQTYIFNFVFKYVLLLKITNIITIFLGKKFLEGNLYIFSLICNNVKNKIS